MERKTGIYAILSPSGKAYIGSSSRLIFRKRRHFSDLKHSRHDNSALQRAWDKYEGRLNYVILEYCDVEMLIVREQYWMDVFSTCSNGTYNQRTIAGKSGPLDESTKKKLSEAMTGFRHSEETKQKMRKPKPEGFGAKLSAAKTGVKIGPRSDEQRQKQKEVVARGWSNGSRDRTKQSQMTKEAWADPEHRRKRSEAIKRAASTPEERAARSERMRAFHVRRKFDMLNWIVGGIFEPLEIGNV